MKTEVYFTSNDGPTYKTEIKLVSFWLDDGTRRPEYCTIKADKYAIQDFLKTVPFDEHLTISKDKVNLFSTFTPNFCAGEELVNLITIDGEIIWSRYTGSKWEDKIHADIINKAKDYDN